MPHTLNQNPQHLFRYFLGKDYAHELYIVAETLQDAVEYLSGLDLFSIARIDKYAPVILVS